MRRATAKSGDRSSSNVIQFTIQVLKGQWFTVFASFLLMAGAGATYLFGIYSTEIKASLGYDQTTLNLLGFSKDLGANAGVMSGLIAEVTPTWFILLVGSVMNFAGYLMIWLAVTGRIAKPKVWHMCIYICIGANSQNFANTGALVTCLKNFPEGRGIMLGLLKGFVGLSAAVLTQMYLAIYGNDSKSLILLISWLPAALSVVFIYSIQTRDIIQMPNEKKVLNRFLYASIGLALFLMVMTTLQKQFVFPKAAYAGSATMVCVLLFVPLIIIIKEELAIWNLKKHTATDPSSKVKVSVQKPAEPKSSPPSLPPSHTPWYSNIFSPPPRGEDYTILQALLSMDMLIIFLIALCGIGSSLTAVDNLGQIGESLKYPARTTSLFISLVSIWNYFGRVFSGFVSEDLIVRYKVPRPLMMVFVLLLSCIGHLLIAFPFPGSLYVATVIIGFSFGAQQPLLPAFISELFGLKYYSTLLNCGQLASPLACYILNVKVTGFLYDREAIKELTQKGMTRPSMKELTCHGHRCYRLPLVIVAVVSLLGAILSLVLAFRTREFYKGDIYKKFKDQMDNNMSCEAEKELDLSPVKGHEDK